MKWKPIETVPKDGTHILVTDGDWVDMGWVQIDDIGDYWGFGLDTLKEAPTHWAYHPVAPNLVNNHQASSTEPPDLPSIEEMSGSIHPDCEIF